MAEIAVIGAGAIGGGFAALLQRAGHRVTLVVRPERVAQLAGGLRVDGALGSWRANVPAAAELPARPDLALLTVKSQDVAAAIAPHLGRLAGAAVVTMQNGVRADEMVATLLPREHVVGAVVFTIATSLEPGAITIAAPGALVVGRPFDPRRGAEDVARVLRDAVPTVTSRNIRGARWLKLLVNLNNAAPALVNWPLQAVADDPFMRRLMVLLVREGARAVERAGIELEALPGMSVGLMRLLTRLPVGLAGALVRRQVRRTSSHEVLGSTLQSLRRGLPTEIAYLNGEIVRLGAKCGAPTPLNAAAVELVGEIERTGRFFTPAELRNRLGSLVS